MTYSTLNRSQENLKNEKNITKISQTMTINDYKLSMNFFRIFSQCILGFGLKQFKLKHSL